MTIQGNKLIADKGKVLRRTVAYPLTGNTITLGKVLIDGELVDDKAEYYKEIDAPKPPFRTRKEIEIVSEQK